MADIKTKQKSTIKKLSKTINTTKQVKRNISETKNKVNNIYEKQNTNPTEYANNKIEKLTQQLKDKAEKLIKTSKKIYNAIRMTLKSIMKGTKIFITALIAGGWIAIVVIIVITLIAFICSSVYGIFLANENAEKTISLVINETNNDFTKKITEIQNNNPHDDFEIHTNKAKWKDILSIYAVLVTGGNEQTEVITMDERKKEILKKVFWDMNQIEYRVEETKKEIEIIDETGNKTKTLTTRKVLYIDVNSKTLEDMIVLYNLNQEQISQLYELQKEEYAKLWSNVLTGTSGGSNDIVEVARNQLGNIGGEIYWSWYGYENRVAWCACFVSWCANECGYIEAGIIPKFSNCPREGIVWFRACELWQNRDYKAKSGDIIFFDWENDGISDHVRNS